LSFKLTPDQEKAAEDWSKVADANTLRFPPDRLTQPGATQIAVYLAASSDEPAVVGAALDAMRTLVRPPTRVDADFVQTIRKHLSSDDPRIVARALAASRAGLNGNAPDRELLSAVLGTATRPELMDGPGRYAVLDALGGLSVRVLKEDEVQKFIFSSLDSTDAYVVMTALELLHTPRVARPDKQLVDKVSPLLADSDPGVRGLTARVLGTVAGADPDAAKALVKALKDEDPFVRSEAANALALLDDRAAIHDIVPLVTDMKKNTFERRWKGMDGQNVLRAYRGSHWPYVAAAAQQALQKLAGADLKLTKVPPNDVEKGLEKNAQAVKAWYAANKAKIARAK
jgi:hypothetical protein